MKFVPLEKLVVDGKEFISIINLEELIPNKPILIALPEFENLQITLVKSNDKVFAISNICPHQHRPSLHNGLVENGCIVCPEHGWTFSLETGENIDKSIGTQKLQTFETIVKNNIVFVNLRKSHFKKWNFTFE